MNSNYQSYKSELQKIQDLGAAIALMSWDKEVYLPSNSAQFRSRQIATLSGMAHEMGTSETLVNLINQLKSDDSLSATEMRNVKQSARSLEKQLKFDTEFVVNKSKTVSKCFHAWIEAKQKNDHSIFIQPMADLMEIVREEAEILGYEHHPYDAMLDLYEPKLTVQKLEAVFNPLKEELSKITSQIRSANQVDDGFLKQHYPKDQQWDFGIEVLKQIGYDMTKGRQDISEHPFTISFSPEDVRVTTRIDEQDMANMLWSCIHEGGHALYEQGLPSDQYGLPLGSAISLGIHESQSRLWENNVGRSIEFWKYHYPALKDVFPQNLGDVSLTQFYHAINKIEPNLIRTEADELHYHLHVIIRYEIEKELMSKQLEVKDIKEAWNAKYKSYLGVDVPDDANGFLQDVHWSHGSIGYFPTYSIGSLYAAQFYAKISETIPGIKAQVKSGDTSQILNWLRENIHQHGQMYDAEDLCEKITGKGLDSRFFLDYVKVKYGEIYGINL